jgi:REP element-mobilizing transposase RayT
VIKHKPHRLDQIFVDQPLFFVTFCARNRGKLPPLDCAKAALETCAIRGPKEFNVDRYVTMPDHIHLFVRGGPNFVLSPGLAG